MIDNTPNIGYYYVTGFSSPSKLKILYCFYCPTIEDVSIEVERITESRRIRGLKSYFRVRQVIDIKPDVLSDDIVL